MTDHGLLLVADGLLKIVQAETLSGLGRSKLYDLMDSGELPYVKIGRARRIPRQALLELMAQHLRGAQRWEVNVETVEHHRTNCFGSRY
jgi:excisionase family DNA binding protein